MQSTARYPWPLRQLRFGLRSVVLVTLLLALVLAGISREHRRVREQELILTELASIGVRPQLSEPTVLGLWLTKRLPGCEAWVQERLGSGWLRYPTVLVSDDLEDRQIAPLVERLKTLETVREIHLRRPRLTAEARAELVAKLPGIGVAPFDNPALQPYYQGQIRTVRFAFAPFAIEALLLLTLIAAMARLFWRWTKHRKARN